jgi:hypothetical protein
VLLQPPDAIEPLTFRVSVSEGEADAMSKATATAARTYRWLGRSGPPLPIFYGFFVWLEDALVGVHGAWNIA